MKVVCTKANPVLLRWCREEAGHTVPDIAKRLKLGVDQYDLLEDGTRHPSLRQLKDLAAVYKRPLAIFFLPQPPVSVKRPQDFRAHKGHFSPATLRSIRRARFIQDNYDSIVDQPIHTELWAPNSNITTNANLARKWLGLTDEDQIRNRNVPAFYKYFVELLEGKNISVLQHSFPKEDAKAYSFAENPKIIVVSTNDEHVGSRIFSILHELGHMSHGHSGICITNDIATSYAKERSCDKFAAEFLMPARLAKPIIDKLDEVNLLNDDTLRATAERLKVSMFALLIRMKEFGYIEQGDIDRKLAEWRKVPRKKSGFAVPTTRAQKAVKESGVPFTEAVVHAYRSDRISVADASYLLNINQSYVSEVGEKVSAG